MIVSYWNYTQDLVQENYPFLAHKDHDRNLMLESMGLESINELFKDIPKEYLLSKELDLPKPLEEWELIELVDKSKIEDKLHIKKIKII